MASLNFVTYEKLFPTFFQAIGGNWFSLSLDKKEYSQIRLHEICAPSTGVVLPKMAHVTCRRHASKSA